ncbi:hypothetical protein GR11A_00192 [Vibrio phage vB_VcorM_GR11A]|nr:hypothetical protein GR11A_00192 [Vibrio phage vB_VcorM_GR11A]
MPSFLCEKCGHWDNTALGLYHCSEEKLCTKCHKGEWHNRFEHIIPVGWGVTHNRKLIPPSLLRNPQVEILGYVHNDGSVKEVPPMKAGSGTLD